MVDFIATEIPEATARIVINEDVLHLKPSYDGMMHCRGRLPILCQRDGDPVADRLGLRRRGLRMPKPSIG